MFRVVILATLLLSLSAFADSLSLTVDFISVSSEMNVAKLEQARGMIGAELSRGEISTFHETKSSINGSVSLCVEAKTEAALLRIQSMLKNAIASAFGSSEYPYPLSTVHPHSCQTEISQRTYYPGGGCLR
jgi:hypothetical protein